MDPELLQLQKLFEAAQEAKASVRLSERNVVELVTKLQELGLLDPDMLHTVSGKEYLTQEQLRIEMETEIKRHGRMSLIDLAATIGVDLFYCERQAQIIVFSNSDLMLVQGEILSADYWDSVAEEVNESLQETGQISLAELAARLNVGAELLTSVLEPRLGRLVHGKLEGGQLYTQAYVARIKAMMRGAVRALMVPTNLSILWSSLQQQLREMDESAVGGAAGDTVLFQTLFNGLMKEGAFLGSVRSGGSVWTPAVFAQAQREAVESFYSQNSYINYDVLRKLAISQPKQYLQVKYPDGIALETVFVHPSFISVIDAAAEEAIDEGGWLDGLSVAPPSFGHNDVAKLVPTCPSVQKAQKESKVVILAETCIVSTVLIKNIFERFEGEFQDLAKAKLIASHSSRSATWNSTKEDDTNEAVREDTKNIALQESSDVQGKTGRRKGSTAASTKSVILERAEDEAPVIKGMKGKKKSGKAKGGKTSSTNEGGASFKGGKGNIERPGPSEDDVLTEEQMEAKILEWFPDMESAGIGDKGVAALSEAVAAHLRPLVISSWKSMRNAAFTAAAEDRRLHLESLQRKVDELYANLQLFTRALDLFEDDKPTLTILQRHLLRTTASEITDLILEAQDLEIRQESGESYESFKSATAGSLSAGQRLVLAKGLHGSLSIKAIKMVEALEGKTVDVFDSALEEVANECGLRLKKLDKKAERNLLHSYRKGLASDIDEESDPVTLLPKVVALLFVQVHNKALQAPGRAMSATVNCLKNGMPDAAFKTLADYHSATVALLSMMSAATPGGTDCTSDRIREKQELLESCIPALKSLVQSTSSNVHILVRNSNTITI